MTAKVAFVAFVRRVLVATKARRFAELAATKNEQEKVLNALCNGFLTGVRPSAICDRDYAGIWSKSCFVFHSPLGFGVEFPTVRDAYEKLTLVDEWLIVVADASARILRPEGRWDNERLIM